MPGEVKEFSVEDAKAGVDVRVLVEDGAGRVALLFAGACEGEELECEGGGAVHAHAVIGYEPMEDEDTEGKSLTIGIGMRWTGDMLMERPVAPCSYDVEGSFFYDYDYGYQSGSLEVMALSDAQAAMYMQRLLGPLEWFSGGS